ncbi:hypothetical protein KR222_000083, partial [Zaprionus bogoriensis]
FYDSGQYDGFVTLLESAITRSSKSYPEYKEDLLRTYTLLTAHFVRQVCCEPCQRRAEWQEKVAQLLHAMDNMHTVSNEVQHLLCRGFGLLVIESRLLEADNHFIAVLRQVPHHVLALLGRACLAYNREEYRVALGYFKDVLLHHPHGPADVRVGIAHCFLQLEDMDSARRAFELALLHNGRCLNALLGMAQLKFNERQRPANLEAVNLLCAAFELNHHHPLVLSWLAGHFYYTRSYEKLQVAAGNAFLITDNAQLKAQNCYQIARSFHAMHNYESAFDFYGKAVHLCTSDYAPPHLGLAQMYVRRGQLDSAEHSLRTLLKLMPHHAQGLRMLATLYAQEQSPSKLDMAIQLFNRVLDPSASDGYDSCLGLARTYERKRLWQQALDAYQQAIGIYQQQHGACGKIPLAWLNNIAAIQQIAELPQAALKTLDQALSISSDEEYRESSRLTLRFNRARVLEQLRQDQEAEQSYKQLILDYPNYYDSYLRLAAMAYKRNHISRAMQYLKVVLELDEGNVAARTLLGNYYMRQGDLSQAMLNYNEILRRPAHSEDCYMRVAVGNVCLVKVERAGAAGDQETAKQEQENALKMFRKAFEQKERNLWAANGIGVALRNHDQLAESETIFKQILESSKHCREALLNSAHIALELEHYGEAIELYKRCLREVPPVNCVQVMQLLARSLHQEGRVADAKEWLLKARHVAPQDMRLLYNVAIAIRQEGSDSFALRGAQLAELQCAERKLKLA